MSKKNVRLSMSETIRLANWVRSAMAGVDKTKSGPLFDTEEVAIEVVESQLGFPIPRGTFVAVLKDMNALEALVKPKVKKPMGFAAFIARLDELEKRVAALEAAKVVCQTGP